MPIPQFIADTINANHLALGLHGFAVEVGSIPAEPVSPTVYIEGIGVDTLTNGAARVHIATPAGQVFPVDLFRAELERIIGKPQSRFYPDGGHNMGYRKGDPFVISEVAEQVDGQTELTLSLGCIA